MVKDEKIRASKFTTICPINKWLHDQEKGVDDVNGSKLTNEISMFVSKTKSHEKIYQLVS